jgi:DNA mismatch repair protein MutS
VINASKTTPLMQQYFAIKAEYPDAMLMFQVGDFYELFFEDAQWAASFLGIALTKRGTNNGEPIPLCGVPIHALDHYLTKLVRGGFKVAICDQLHEAVPGKVVERGVTRVLTPGTLTDSKLLDAKSASYLCSFFPVEDQWGLVFAELLTAQLFATVLPISAHKMLESEIIRFFPDEILVPETKEGKPFQPYFKQLGYFITMLPSQEDSSVHDWLERQFKQELVSSLHSQKGLMQAVTMMHDYLKKNQQESLGQFRSINFYKPDDFLIMDSSTQKNLELVKNSQDGGATHTLFNLIDKAHTSMGSRMLKKWLMRPLVKKEAIIQRQDAVQMFMQDVSCAQIVAQLLKEVGDLERVVGRMGLHRAQVHDYLMLKQALAIVPSLIKQLRMYDDISLIHLIISKIADFSPLHGLLSRSINDDRTKEWLIKEGFDAALDRIRGLIDNSHTKIIELERREQEKTGIQSLKVRYNQVHGYYIEVTKANLDAIPDAYIRQQTLVGRERFITPELRDLQAEILTARQEVGARETELYETVKAETSTFLVPLRLLAQALSHIDALGALGTSAYEQGYTRPSLSESRDIIIEEGRHPVIAANISNQFIPNDTHLTDDNSLWIITGPNMGGKSTYLRQVALISVMAQCGSFVPAAQAKLPIIDRIFTRMGASDHVAGGKSTFLVEMEETALICTQATQNSLVILDEVGRGTSTYDGLALAQAVIEYLYHTIQARCLFATHYHELTELEHSFKGISTYHAASKKTDDGILFLHKIVRGTAEGSFGLEVAKIANLPSSIINRAKEILVSLEDTSHVYEVKADPSSNSDSKELTELRQELETKNRILSKFLSLDYDNLSPRKAFDLLWSLRGGDSLDYEDY